MPITGAEPRRKDTELTRRTEKKGGGGGDLPLALLVAVASRRISCDKKAEFGGALGDR